ncbi:hypothetical protein B0H13DRAFT_1970030 [Mycena leptocephala]|nr:hypothetical protein B0H13DRAFT_1970030 [Mycena leptocephala]
MAVLWRGRRGTFPPTSLYACADYASALGQGIHALPHLAVLKRLWSPVLLATPPHTTYALRFLHLREVVVDVNRRDGRIVLAVPFVLDLQSSSSTARSGMDERRPCRAWEGGLWGDCVLHAGDAIAHDSDFSSSTCCHLACGTRSRGDGSTDTSLIELSLEPFKR